VNIKFESLNEKRFLRYGDTPSRQLYKGLKQVMIGRNFIVSALKSPGLGPTRYTFRESLIKPQRQNNFTWKFLLPS